jgi:hypothetical protein
MADNFGARLRQHREERQIDLLAISEQTKIKLSLLEALEHDDVSQWPSGIFRRAYIRTYAQFIGLDPDPIVREFLELHPDPGDAFTALGASLDEEPKTDGPPPTRLRTMVDSAIASLARRRRHAPVEDPRPDVSPVPAATTAMSSIGTTPPASATIAEEAKLDHESVEVHASAAPVIAEPVAIEPQEGDVVAASPALAACAEAPGETTLEVLARVCTEIGQVADRDEIPVLLRAAAAALNATGLIVWVWEDREKGLKPALVHGYPQRVVAHLPVVRWDADNATAAAFRTRNVCDVAAAADTNAALAIPLLVPDACAGVLAIELQHGVEPAKAIRAAAVVLAASVAQLVHRSRSAASRVPAEDPVPAVMFRAPARPMKVRR